MSAAITDKAPQRLLSVDALRGFDMFWIMGGEALLVSILKHVPGEWATNLRTQFTHVEWEGFRFYDLIFPLFLFLVGCVLPFSLEKYRETPRAVYLRVARRVLLLFTLGLICNGLLQLKFEEFRVAGVLQRIAICYGIAALIWVHCRLPLQVAIFLGILMGYWAVLAWVPVPDGTAGDFSQAGNLAGYIDRTYLPGTIKAEYYGFGDNEGLLSTIPAVATVLLGAFAGQFLKSNRSHLIKVAVLSIAGILCVTMGMVWGHWFPIIKNLWTSSFVLLAGGYSLLLLALFYGLVDGFGFRRSAFFWMVIGANAIAIFIVPRFLDFNHASKFFFGGVAGLAGSYGPTVLVAGKLTLCWLLLWWMYRNKIFIRV